MKLSKERIRKEFALRLQNALDERDWSQSDLAKRVAPLLKNSRLGRDNISKYVRAIVLPLPPTRAAIAKALGVDIHELLPRDASTAEEANGHCEKCEALRKERDRARADADEWRNQATYLREDLRVLKDLNRLLTPYGRNRSRVPPRTPQRPTDGDLGNGQEDAPPPSQP
jgi:transcriptional regulator with XRE-family HTH domain